MCSARQIQVANTVCIVANIIVQRPREYDNHVLATIYSHLLPAGVTVPVCVCVYYLVHSSSSFLAIVVKLQMYFNFLHYSFS